MAKTIMKKALKVAGIAVGGYFGLNTLLWAFVGTGRYMNDVYSDEEHINELATNFSTSKTFEYALNKVDESFEAGIEGWKTWAKNTFRR